MNRGNRIRVGDMSRDKLTRADEKLKQLKLEWVSHIKQMGLLTKAINEASINPAGAVRVLQQVKEHRDKRTTETDEWARARRAIINEAAKDNMLKQSVGHTLPQQPQQCPPWTTQQYQVQPYIPQGGGSQHSSSSYGSYSHKGDKGKGKGKGGKGGKNFWEDKPKHIALDTPQRSRCPMLKGPFAPDYERYDCSHPCKKCQQQGVEAYHAGSWECDVQYYSARSMFMRGEVDRWGASIVNASLAPNAFQGLARPQPPPGAPPAGGPPGG